ncbi:MAG: YciI family protein [Rhizobiaceae bacterium]|nr:YciI family protein [Rhizobiaceae bacterium]
MKYLALIYSPQNAAPAYGTPEFDAFIGEYQAATEVYAKDKVMIAGEALEDSSTATTIRVRDGKTETIDGPFVETKEQLGGFYLFDCENLDEAIKYAAMIPSAKHGAVELRPVQEFS